MSEPTIETMTRVVAEKVFDWKPCDPINRPVWYRKPDGTETCINNFRPRTDGNDMLLVIEGMQKKGFKMTILVSEGRYSPYDVTMLNRSIVATSAGDDIKRAVLTAAYKAAIAMEGE